MGVGDGSAVALGDGAGLALGSGDGDGLADGAGVGWGVTTGFAVGAGVATTAGGVSTGAVGWTVVGAGVGVMLGSTVTRGVGVGRRLREVGRGQDERATEERDRHDGDHKRAGGPDGAPEDLLPEVPEPRTVVVPMGPIRDDGRVDPLVKVGAGGGVGRLPSSASRRVVPPISAAQAGHASTWAARRAASCSRKSSTRNASIRRRAAA